MPKENTNEPKKPAFNFSVIKVTDIPQQKRFGRTSKFNPLLERLQTLKETETMQFPIEKYTQIQGLRNKLKDAGFIITTRSNRSEDGKTTSLIAYIYKTPPEKKS